MKENIIPTRSETIKNDECLYNLEDHAMQECIFVGKDSDKLTGEWFHASSVEKHEAGENSQ